MPIIKSAKKALRSSLKKKSFNAYRKKEMASVLKTIKKLVSEKKIDEAKSLIPKAYQAIDKATKRGIIKENAGSRKKSRITTFIKKNSS